MRTIFQIAALKFHPVYYVYLFSRELLWSLLSVKQNGCDIAPELNDMETLVLQVADR